MTADSFSPRAAILCLGACVLAGCVGGLTDHLGPAALDGEHPFPVREASLGQDHHDVHGVDVAKFQNEIAWADVRNSGIEFAFIKATEGADRIDDRFQQNWLAAKEAGLPRGAYHFNYWCSPMSNQIDWFKRNVPVDPDALPPVLDLEWNFSSPTCPRKVEREVALPAIHSFLTQMEAHYRKRPIIYTDIVFHRDILSDGAFSNYPIWVRSVKDLPQSRYPGRSWALWQYTERGAVPGIRGNVDKNAFAGTRSQWRKLVDAAFLNEKQASR